MAGQRDSPRQWPDHPCLPAIEHGHAGPCPSVRILQPGLDAIERPRVAGGNNARLGTGWFVSRQVRLAIDDAGRFHPADWRGDATRSPSWHILADGPCHDTSIVRFTLARFGAVQRDSRLLSSQWQLQVRRQSLTG
jgi:hypothetical protein